MKRLGLELLGVGAMRSPRYAPAGLLVRFGAHRVVIDGGPGAAPPPGRLDAWLVTDEHCELIAAIRRLARGRGLEPKVATWKADGLVIRPRPVVHTSHAAFGYLIEVTSRGRMLRCAWAPEFFRFPRWVSAVDLMFAEASSFAQPVRLTGGVGGHMAVIDVAREAERSGVRRLVFAHIGKSSIRAREAGAPLSFGEWASDGDVFVLGR
ncbi:hypothetical protein AKJ09_04992 [Labilithrix luteola]|uniref:Metallo-beta-lactamase domain-containing protein n=1 Tax=Labilithrix luteola TaxID=1391654 RepID=A0A0K1PXS9_9BACT|nr:hypothetical protein [Labilithrix luteola]AKU98328.1 hypothetical protein AKJ09_04992 [Labilithrix luteola]